MNIYTAGNTPAATPVIPLSSRAASIRARYIKDAERDIERRLEASIHHARFVDLGILDDPSAIRPPWGYHDPETKTSYRTVFDAFMAYERRLLLLGHPGSGKSTTLLHLAKLLLNEANADQNAPIPFIFNLSKFKFDPSSKPILSRNWMRSRDGDEEENRLGMRNTAFEDWLIAEMESYPGLSRKIAEEWLKQGRIVVLLDGLDEVDDQLRGHVVRLLNTTFLPDYPDTGVVVCSRTNEYATLKSLAETRLELRGCVHLQPLSEKQISGYLHAAQATELLGALPKDEALRELAKTPLTLSMLVLAYGGLAPGDLPAARSLSERRHHLFESYVARMLQRYERRRRDRPFDDRRSNDVPISEYQYRPEQVDRWLGWLAIALSVRAKTTFSVPGLHAVLRVALSPDRQPYNFWAVYEAVAVFPTLFLVLIASTIGAFSQSNWSHAALILAATFAGVPLAAAVAKRGSPTGGIALGLIFVLAVGAIAQALSAKLAIGIPALPMSVIAFATVVAGLFLAYAIREDADEKAISLSVVAAVLVGYGLFILARWLTIPFLSTPWGLALLLTFGIALSIAIYVAVDGNAMKESVLAFPIAFGIAGASIAGTALIGELDSENTLITLGVISIATVGSGGIEWGIAMLAGGLLFGLAGSMLDGFHGAIIGIASFYGFIAALSIGAGARMEKNERFKRLTLYSIRSGAKALQLVDRYLLSPTLWFGIAIGNRFPFRHRRFISFCQETFLLKQSSKDFEFIHRLLRDYFALRQLLPKVLSSADSQRVESIKSLGYQGESALEFLSELAGDENAVIRAAAITGMGHISSPLVAQFLERHLNDTAIEVRQSLIPSLLNLPKDDMERLLRALKPIGDGCEVHPLLGGADKVYPYNELIVQELVRLGIVAVKPLLARLHDKNPKVRECVAKALGELGDKRAVAPLTDLLGDKRFSVCWAVIEALGKLKDQQAIKPLLARWGKGKDSYDRTLISKAIVEIGGEQAIEALASKLPESSLYFEKCIKKLGEDHGKAALIRLLQNPTAEVRRRAIVELARFFCDFTDQRLLSESMFPFFDEWIDPQLTITQARVTELARRLGVSEENVRSRYERLARELGLKLSWS